MYYIKKENLSLLNKYLGYVSRKTQKSRFAIARDAVHSVFRYNISLKDYFSFKFSELDPVDREKWAGTGFMYEYQLQMNPKGSRIVLEDKILFLKYFNDLIKRQYLPVTNKGPDLKSLTKLLGNPSGRLVLKNSLGQTGSQVEIISCNEFTPESLQGYMKRKKYNLIEEYVFQHPDLNSLSSSGLNTVRIITQLDNGLFYIVGTRLRVSVNSPVDNLAAGNLAAPVETKTGVVNGPGVFSDITKEPVIRHPVTGERIEGFTIPYWKEILILVENAARRVPDNRSVGWDIAVTPEGPELIEGNHNWCKLLWQLPARQGLKGELLKFI